MTQFEPTDARRCFPCWDEPSLKATFGMTLTVADDRVALSNMPEKSVTRDAEAKVRSIQKCFTHRPVSTFDRVPFQLTDELVLYGMALRRRP